MSLPAKSWSYADFAQQSYGAMPTSPRKITKPSFLAPQNYGYFVLCPAKLWSNADLAPQNCADIVLGANKFTQTKISSLISNYF